MSRTERPNRSWSDATNTLLPYPSSGNSSNTFATWPKDLPVICPYSNWPACTWATLMRSLLLNGVGVNYSGERLKLPRSLVDLLLMHWSPRPSSFNSCSGGKRKQRPLTLPTCQYQRLPSWTWAATRSSVSVRYACRSGTHPRPVPYQGEWLVCWMRN